MPHMEPICWSEDWAVGIPMIDTQHLRLFEMIEDLRVAVVVDQQKSAATIAKVLKGLITYCGEHFECEQMLMQSVKYPIHSSHLGIHRHFTDTAIQWFEDFQAGKLNPEVVLDALLEWLVSHIKENDTKIAAHCNRVGIACASLATMQDVIARCGGHGSGGGCCFACQTKISSLPIESILAMLLSPTIVIYSFVAYLRADTTKVIIACAGLVVIVASFFLVAWYVRAHLRTQTRGLRLAHANQLASNMLAGEIARRVATMNLDNIEELFASEANPLVRVLQDIVENLKVYLPYLPESVLALVRGEDGDGEGNPDDNNGAKIETYGSDHMPNRQHTLIEDLTECHTPSGGGGHVISIQPHGSSVTDGSAPNTSRSTASIARGLHTINVSTPAYECINSPKRSAIVPILGHAAPGGKAKANPGPNQHGSGGEVGPRRVSAVSAGSSNESPRSPAISESGNLDVNFSINILTQRSSARSNAPNLNRTVVPFVLELKHATAAAAEGEWMYVLQDASAKDPYATYHDALAHLFFGSAEKGAQMLKEYLQHAKQPDVIAADLLETYERLSSRSSSKASGGALPASEVNFTWVHGWVHP